MTWLEVEDAVVEGDGAGVVVEVAEQRGEVGECVDVGRVELQRPAAPARARARARRGGARPRPWACSALADAFGQGEGVEGALAR